MRHPCLKKTKNAEKPPKNTWLIGRLLTCFLGFSLAIVSLLGFSYPTNGWFNKKTAPNQITLRQNPSWAIDRDSQFFGPHYNIMEEDFISVLQRRFSEFRSNHPAGLKHAWVSHINDSFNVIKPKQRLPRATQYRFWYQNPTIVLKKDVRDDHNTIIAARGTVMNPLIATPLNETLLLFDADDQQQIKFIKRTLKRGEKNNIHYKLIVVQGNLSAAHIKLKQKVYADQHSELTQYFHLHRLPVLIKQVDLRLKLEEFPT